MTAGLPEGTVTVMFTDVEGSSELTNRLGDAAARELMREMEASVREQVQRHHGVEVKGTGDGLMLAFQSARRAVQCAVAIQKTLARNNRREPGLRIGLHTGEVIRDDEDLFGSTVNLAARIADKADAGGVLLSDITRVVMGAGTDASLVDRGIANLKGFAEPVRLFAVEWTPDAPPRTPGQSPFIGRSAELARLGDALDRAKVGQGGLMTLVGEPGIGKSRTIDEFGAAARRDGAIVLTGRCYEGEWAPPYSPFVEAITGYVDEADPATLEADLGFGAAPLSRLVPAVRRALPDLPEPVPLQPDEERFRILDAASQFIVALSKRAPVVVMLDDLQWADAGSLAMLRHVARFAPRERLLLVGAYRDVELDRQHPLTAALRELRREAEYQRIQLTGLEREEVATLVTALAEHELPRRLVEAVEAETDGNPFFVREVLLHLMEAGMLRDADGSWRADVNVDEIGIPEGVREVVLMRLSRLSEAANTFLSTASAFDGPFRFDVATKATGIPETEALDALDEALEAQLLKPAGEPESYEFGHANIRHTLYKELSPSRQVRLHRLLAETIEELAGDDVARYAADLAYHYHRASPLPGTERGAEHALAAADQAESSYAWEQVAAHLRIAEELLAGDDARRPQVLARLAEALAWSLEGDDAGQKALEAVEAIAVSAGPDAAADAAADLAATLNRAQFRTQSWSVAEAGLRYAGDRRDATWALLAQLDLNRRRADDPEDPGIVTDTPEQKEIVGVVEGLPEAEQARMWLASSWITGVRSREQALALNFPEAAPAWAFWGGDGQRALPVASDLGDRCERSGCLGDAVGYLSVSAAALMDLGRPGEARTALDRAGALIHRLPGASNAVFMHMAWELWYARYFGETTFTPAYPQFLLDSFANLDTPEQQWTSALLKCVGVLTLAEHGHGAEAIPQLEPVIDALDRAPGRVVNYIPTLELTVLALWAIDRNDYTERLERNLRDKILQPDFRYICFSPAMDMARICAVQRRMDEAIEWFQVARDKLNETGSRTLLAICDYHEALALQRAGGDSARIISLLAAAERQMTAIGMPAWLRQVQELRASLA